MGKKETELELGDIGSVGVCKKEEKGERGREKIETTIFLEK